MTRLAQTERHALCDTALEVGEDRPTLSGEWTVKDLVVHLLVREGSPASIGIAVAPLAPVTAAVSRWVARADFVHLVERLRGGPPRLSPFAIPRLDVLGNTLEFFVHHEDIRRAQPGWEPRTLGAETDRLLWTQLSSMGKRLARALPVGLVAQDATTGATAELRSGTPSVTVRGAPSEVTMYLFGRSPHARVDLLGDGDAVARLSGTSLGP
jgi:uncharacterized protein (TIGR03085 family)